MTVTNNGRADLAFGAGALTLTGGDPSQFAVDADDCSNQTLTTGDTCTADVTFTLPAPESRAKLTFTDNAPGSPHTVALTGTGLSPAPTPPPMPTPHSHANADSDAPTPTPTAGASTAVGRAFVGKVAGVNKQA